MKFKLILLGLIISFSVRGQETIKGLAYDKTGPTPGVMVTELGTDNKVMTDAKGEFEIKTKMTSPTLTFTFIGFVTRTIKIKRNKFLKVKMKWDKPKYKDIARSNYRQQKVYAMRGFSVGIKSNFLISFSNVGQFWSRSVLAFRYASLLSPPNPRTA